jgi:HlyD family secretion protein
MPATKTTENPPPLHTEDMQDIITTIPSWLLRWGITLFFCLLLMILALSALIHYPDIVKAPLKISSPNSPKPVVTKVPGRLMKLFVKENQDVKAGQPLGYMESAANHDDVIALLSGLKIVQKALLSDERFDSTFFTIANIAQFGELQASYQVFFHEYLSYRSSVGNEFEIKKRTIASQNTALAKLKFGQALNSLISQAEDWKRKYVLTAPQNGRLMFADMIEENQFLVADQQVFYINSGNETFFGEMAISQSNLGKVEAGQEVLIKLESYPFEDYGILKGKIKYISEVPYKDGIFMSRVEFQVIKTIDLKSSIHLRQGMLADAEVVTQDATLLQRITRNLLKLLQN